MADEARRAELLAKMDAGAFDTPSPSGADESDDSTTQESQGAQGDQQGETGSNQPPAGDRARGADGKFQKAGSSAPPVPGSPARSAAPPVPGSKPPADAAPAQGQEQRNDEHGFPVDKPIPYTRLRQVISQREALRQELEAHKAETAKLKQALELRTLAFPQQQQPQRDAATQKVIDDIWGEQPQGGEPEVNPLQARIDALEAQWKTAQEQQRFQAASQQYDRLTGDVLSRYPHLPPHLFHLAVSAAVDTGDGSVDFEEVAETLDHHLRGSFAKFSGAGKATTTQQQQPQQGRADAPPRPTPAPPPNGRPASIKDGVDLKDPVAVRAAQLALLKQRGL